ncbi:MAG: alpha-E domain-containing protein [Candidatus Dormibacteraeota bacterium]|nr:alpha-E domain-containing protein [Candidatus Dormibacteraeota bacterium]
MSLYQVGRRLEAADHLARILDVHHSVYLDRPGEVSPDFWDRFLALASVRAAPDADADQAALLTLAEIRTQVVRAREAALSVRPSISSELFEQLTVLNWTCRANPEQLHDFLSTVQMGVHLLTGLAEDSMNHDEAWNFLRLGRYRERALAVARLVTVKLSEIDDEPVLWAAVLRCCSALESYRWRYSAPVTVEGVVGFLLLDPHLPRSVAFAIGEALAAAGQIDGSGPKSAPHRILGRLAALFEYTDRAEISADPSVFGMHFFSLMETLDKALASTYFRPSKVASTTLAVLTEQPQQ